MFRLEVHDSAQEELLALPKRVQARLIRQLDKLRANPTVLREPDSKPLGNGLFEIRTVGFFHTRGIYVYRRGKVIWLLRVFVKKTQKTPKAELHLAMNRLKEMHDE
ncbi:MAG: type II toxin-antitoxin system RelE/ParE family toxin [Scandinavium sp.]|uniref:type II toxin-antitoxin system RelE/ParE family toxin n=1 Tax=Scandinavium sp. TaxID=2830653 RepID=UPI003F3A5DD9